ncbi:MAG: 6-bladed beta-propeller [Bacteroidota bacterium]|nr:6-bladed beta-propeller [Bacteroidota bacterium]
MKRNKIKMINKYLTITMQAFIAFLLIGCSASKDAQKTDIVWPSPPDEPRVKYIKTYQSEDEFLSGFGKAVRMIAGEKSTIGLSKPFDVTTDGKGKIFVSDMEQGLVMFDEVEKKVVPIGQKSIYPLGRVVGLAYGNNKLFVGSTEIKAVIALTLDGQVVQTFGELGQFQNPVDVAYDKYLNRVIVVDNKIHQVVVFSENGDSLFTIGQRGEGDGEFNFPQSAAVDKQSNIYIVDAFNFRVQVFDKDGKFLRKYGQQGEVYGMFSRPKGIALDGFNNIYVVDAIHNNFQIFNNDFELLMFVGRYAVDDNLGFMNPIGIDIDESNRIYVADQLNSRVQVFQLLKGN